MELVLFVLIAIVALILLDTASARFGVDSRPGSADPRQPAPGLFVR